MDPAHPAPTANPHAKLVTECFEECPARETPARSSLFTALPDWEGSGRRGAREPAVDEEGNHSREGKVADVLFGRGCEEVDMSPSSQGWLPGLAGHGRIPSGEGQQTSVVKTMSKSDLVGCCTLPSFKELGLDKYVERRD